MNKWLKNTQQFSFLSPSPRSVVSHQKERSNETDEAKKKNRTFSLSPVCVWAQKWKEKWRDRTQQKLDECNRRIYDERNNKMKMYSKCTHAKMERKKSMSQSEREKKNRGKRKFIDRFTWISFVFRNFFRFILLSRVLCFVRFHCHWVLGALGLCFFHFFFRQAIRQLRSFKTTRFVLAYFISRCSV